MSHKDQSRAGRPQTESDVTLDDLYEQVRFQTLTSQQQTLVYAHHMDQYNAVPPYTERKQKGNGDSLT